MRFTIEYTDTFGGEPNYSWVYRHSFERKDSVSDLALVRYAKKYLGLSGVKCERLSWGDLIEIRPRGMATVAFISLEEED